MVTRITGKTLASAVLSVYLAGAGIALDVAASPLPDPDFGTTIFFAPSAIGWDYLYAIKPGPSGSFYLSGHYSLTKMSPENFPLWTIPLDFRINPEIGVDASDNIYTTAQNVAGSQSLALKYSTDGQLLKTIVLPYAGEIYQSRAMGMAFDVARRRLYVCGAYYNSDNGGYKTYVALYDSELALIKTEEYGIASDHEHYVVPEAGIDIDASGNIYVGGSRGDNGINKYMVLKYSPELGQMLWANFEPGPRPRTPIIRAVPGGGAVMADSGDITPASGLPRPALRRVSADGVFGAPMLVPVEKIERLIAGPDGSAYVVAYDSARRLVLGRIKPNNTYAWSPGFFWDELDTEAVYVDGQNRIYSAGFYDYFDPFSLYYFARYVQNEEPVTGQYVISKVTPPEPHLVNINAYSEPLVSQVSDPEGNPTGNIIALTFSISTWPAGAVGQELTRTGANTDQSLADVKLKLGNIPAEYGVTAKCENCAPETSSVTFTCCGKLPNDHFSQTYTPMSPWNVNCYARHNCQVETGATIGYLGCGVTALATLSNYYAANVSTSIPTTNPGMLNTYLRGLPGADGYNRNNDVEFSAIETLSSSTVRYIRDESASTWQVGITRQILIDRTNREMLAGRPAILQIRRRRSDGTFRPHFIVAVGKCGNNYSIADPIGGEERLYSPTEPNALLIGIRVFRP